MKALKASDHRLKHMYNPPFGYDVTDDGYLIPIEDDLYALEQVAELLDIKALSLRDAALWLSSNCSRTISHEGLRKRIKFPIRFEEVDLF